MKRILQSILVNSVAIALTSLILPSISYSDSVQVLIMAAIVLGISNTLIKPIITLVLLPVSIITLGIAGWFINALMLLLTSVIVPQFNILPWHLTVSNTVIPISLFWSYVITSFVLNFVLRIIHGIIHEE